MGLDQGIRERQEVNLTDVFRLVFPIQYYDFDYDNFQLATKNPSQKDTLLVYLL